MSGTGYLSRLPSGLNRAIHMRLSLNGESSPDAPGWRSLVWMKPATHATRSDTSTARSATPGRLTLTTKGWLGGLGPVERWAPVFGLLGSTRMPVSVSLPFHRAALLSSAVSPRSSVSVTAASKQVRKISTLEAVGLLQMRASVVQQGRDAPTR